MVQTSVHTPGSRNVSQEGRGCLVGDQGGSVVQTKLHNLKWRV